MTSKKSPVAAAIGTLVLIPSVFHPLPAAADPGAVTTAADSLSNWSEVRTQNDAPSECADFLFIGVRGSGERSTDSSGYGRIVQIVRDGVALAARPELTVRQIALDYPSLPIFPTDGFSGSLKEDVESLLPWSSGAEIDYYSSINEGWYQLTRAIIDSRQRCKEHPEKVVLVGYSQGALVVHKTLAEIGDFPELAGAVLVADPARNVTGTRRTDVAMLTGQPVTTQGVWESIGLAKDLYGTIGSIPSESASKTAEICNAGDIVCDPGQTSVATWLDGLELGAGVRIHSAYGTADVEAQGIDEETLRDVGAWAGSRANLAFDQPWTGSAIVAHLTEPVPYLLGAGPYSMAARHDGTVFVTSGGNRRDVFAFTPGGGGYSAYSTPSALNPAYPYAVATDWAGNLYATNTYATKLVKYTSSGPKTFDIAQYNVGTWGDSGSPLAVDRDGNIYLGRGMGVILDGCGYGKGRIGLGNVFKLSPQGDYLGEYSTGNFRAITSDALGNVYVLTAGKGILRIAADGTLSTYATMPDSFGWIGADMTSDTRGNLYVINSATTSCIWSPISPDPTSSPIWRVDATSRHVSELDGAKAGRSQIAMISDGELAVYTHDFSSGGTPSVERITIGTPKSFDLLPQINIEGQPLPGQTLTAVVASWNPTPTSFTYQWLRDGQPIVNENQAQYVVRSEDAGCTLQVNVTGSKMGYVTLTIGLAQVTVPDPDGELLPFQAAPAPTLTGVARIGAPLTADVGAWVPAPTAVDYQWMRNGVPVEGASASAYTLTSADAGAQIAVAVTATRSGYAPTQRTSLGVSVEPELTNSLTDVDPASPFYADITWLASQGITKPGPDGRFDPNAPVQRAAMAAFLYRAAFSPTYVPPVVSPFSDVATTDAFYTEMSWLYAQGITKPGSDGEFGPGGSVSRSAMAAFLYRFAGSPTYTPTPTSPFTDVATSDPFFKEMSWLYAQGITKPGQDGRFGAGDPVSREAMAAFLHRANTAGLLSTPR